MIPRITIRIDQKTIDLIDSIAKQRGEQLSDFVRRAIRLELASLGYLKENERKALGIDKK